ncbi:MAG: hypothetical protein RL196_81 [Actinomycetota bacterium]
MAVQLQPTICIVGSGPSGCYLAQFLLKQWPESQIVIVDRLDHPYGLALYGVAPDHHGTRAVTKQFDRLWLNPNVKFVGNIEVGRDLELAELQANFDIVVLATGLHQDRKLSIVGGSLPGVVGAGRVTRLINAHPHEPFADFAVGQSLVIVGQGNVAIDIVRLSLSDPAKLSEIGVPASVIDALRGKAIQHISVVGRSSCELAKFDAAMIKELAQLSGVSFSAHNLEEPASHESKSAKVAAVRDLVESSPANATVSVDFYFGWQPSEISGDKSVEVIRFTSLTQPNETLELKADTVITAIGFEENDAALIRRAQLVDAQSNIEAGVLSAGLYCVGWFRRGPTGTIPANRADAKMVSESILSDFENSERLGVKLGLPAVKKLQEELNS